MLTVGLGLLLGGPLAVWLLTIRDQGLFQLVFTVAFFCLSWYNGPITAVIFDVVPARISATVAGAYLLFIHLAGDAIAPCADAPWGVQPFDAESLFLRRLATADA